MKKIIFIAMFGLSFCSGSGIYKDVQGSIKSTSPTSLNIPTSPTPTISILGRSADEFTVEYIQNTLGTPVANFIIRNVPTKQPLVFQLTAGTFDPIISFPFDLTKTAAVTLPALESGTTANIISEVQTVSGQSITTTTGIILGQLNSVGGATGGCTPIESVQIKDKETNVVATVVGPFYFDATNHVVNTGHFSDSQCNYVMANVLPGTYILQFLDSSLVQKKEIEVIVLPGNVSFGMDVP